MLKKCCDTKQVIVIRRDLKTRRGKEIAQGSHASVAFIGHKIRKFLGFFLCRWSGLYALWLTKPERAWLMGSFAKVVCQVGSEEELREIHQKAREAGLESHLIIDSGKTEFKGIPTPTACGIGPDYVEKFSGVTDDLKLY